MSRLLQSLSELWPLTLSEPTAVLIRGLFMEEPCGIGQRAEDCGAVPCAAGPELGRL